MNKFFLILSAVLFLGSVEAYAADPVNNVYYNLYVKRLEVRQGEVNMQQVLLDHTRAKYLRMKELHDSNMVSDQELENHQKDVQIAELKLLSLQAQASEAEAMLNIARERITLGIEMPICPGGI